MNYVQDYLGTSFLVGLDRLITYNIVNRINDFFSIYGLLIGGGGVSQKKKDVGKVFNKDFYKNLGDMDNMLSMSLGQLNPDFLKNYKTLKQQMSTNYNSFMKPLLEIGQLQILRKLVC